MRKKLFLLVVSLILLTTVVSAGVLGGKWNTSPTYYIDSGNAYYPYVLNSVTTWNNAFSSINSSMRITAGTAFNATVTILTNAYGYTGWNAQGEPGPDPLSGTYSYATIRINTTVMDGFVNGKKYAILNHEFGHVLGLAHNDYTEPRTLMYGGGSGVYYDQWQIIAPQANDKADLDYIY